MDKCEAAMLLGLMREQFKELDDSLECDSEIDMALQMAIHCLIESHLASVNVMFSALLEKGDQNDTTN